MKLSELKTHCSNLRIDYVEFCLSRYGMEMLEWRYNALKNCTPEQTESYQALQLILEYRKVILLSSKNEKVFPVENFIPNLSADLRKALYGKELAWEKSSFAASSTESANQLSEFYTSIKLQDIFEVALTSYQDDLLKLKQGIISERILASKFYFFIFSLARENLDDLTYFYLFDDFDDGDKPWLPSISFYLKLIPVSLAAFNRRPEIILGMLTGYYIYEDRRNAVPGKRKWGNTVLWSTYLLYLGIAFAYFHYSDSNLLDFIALQWVRVIAMACGVPYVLKGIQEINQYVLMAIVSPTAYLLRPMRYLLREARDHPVKMFPSHLMVGGLSMVRFSPSVFPELSAYWEAHPFLSLLIFFNVISQSQALSQMAISIWNMVRHIGSANSEKESFYYDVFSLWNAALTFLVLMGVMWHQFTLSDWLDSFVLQAFLIGLTRLEFFKPLEKNAKDFYQELSDYSFLVAIGKGAEEGRRRHRQLPSAKFVSHRVFNTQNPDEVPIFQRHLEFFTARPDPKVEYHEENRGDHLRLNQG